MEARRVQLVRGPRAEVTDREKRSDFNMPGSTGLQVVHPQEVDISRDAPESCGKDETRRQV
ncbi:hypothetical protein DPMN_173111 [Dreissena polymorpha]|uniref:Uncharacterized protein n=1 Tax=Dreissena polymorpha TaxID=45954 RepID=A0A9D4E4U5_DREPO|nr:hypothetical protein DPMN_173111 [Dreissena polymorpha]